MPTDKLLFVIKVIIAVLAIAAGLLWMVMTTFGWGISQLEFKPGTAINFPLMLLSGWGVILAVAAVPLGLIKLAEANARKKFERERDETPPPSDPPTPGP